MPNPADPTPTRGARKEHGEPELPDGVMDRAIDVEIVSKPAAIGCNPTASRAT